MENFNLTSVIPAQAGIQLIKQSPRSGTKPGSCPLRGMFVSLDSRLRGNDGVFCPMDNFE
jgi:hypothetical protein